MSVTQLTLSLGRILVLRALSRMRAAKHLPERRKLTCVVPTAADHQLRKPNSRSPAYPAEAATPRRLPAAESKTASRMKIAWIVWDEKPIDRSSPISRTLCSTPRRKNRAASRTAETIRKKLKYRKYSPKSVLPCEASIPAPFTERSANPDISGSSRECSSRENVPKTAPAVSPSEGRSLMEEYVPNRVRQRSWPFFRRMNALGVVRYRFQ